jgi:hypothetical protein
VEVARNARQRGIREQHHPRRNQLRHFMRLVSLISSLTAPTKVRDPGHDGAWPSRNLSKT